MQFYTLSDASIFFKRPKPDIQRNKRIYLIEFESDVPKVRYCRYDRNNHILATVKHLKRYLLRHDNTCTMLEKIDPKDYDLENFLKKIK